MDITNHIPDLSLPEAVYHICISLVSLFLALGIDPELKETTCLKKGFNNHLRACGCCTQRSASSLCGKHC